jgi:hypothetical protein
MAVLEAAAVSSECSKCGFAAGALSDYDLFVSLLGMPGRYRELLAGYGTLESIDPMIRARHDATAWSALERLAHVADAFHAAARCTVSLLEGGRASSTRPVHVDAPRADANATPARAVLAYLDAAVTDLARAVGQSDSDDARVRRLLEGAVHQASHHLADTQALLDEAARGYASC